MDGHAGGENAPTANIPTICANIVYVRQYGDMRIGKKWRMAIPIANTLLATLQQSE